MKFSEWVKGQRGRSLAIAQAVGVTPPVVSDWVMGKKAIAAEHCKAIERLTGGAVTCQEMRPLDWHKYWPELAQGDEPSLLRSGADRRHTGLPLQAPVAESVQGVA